MIAFIRLLSWQYVATSVAMATLLVSCSSNFVNI